MSKTVENHTLELLKAMHAQIDTNRAEMRESLDRIEANLTSIEQRLLSIEKILTRFE